MDFISTIPLANGCSVIASDDCGLIAINKKAGRASHPNGPRPDRPAMVMAAYNFDREYFSWIDDGGIKRRLYLINRLDAPTSGVILASSTAEAAAAAKAQFRNKAVEKTYAAIILGKLRPERGLWTDRISTSRIGGRLRSRAGGPAAHAAATSYEVETFGQNGANLTFVKLSPKTGLTHQLRLQCALRRHPILGDATYGDFAANKRFRALSKIDRLFLHCLRTSLTIELDGKSVEFAAEAPLPESFGADINGAKF